MEFVTSFPHYLSNKLSYVETMQVQNRSGTVTVTISSPCTSVALLYIQPLDLLATRLCFRPTDIHTKLKRGKKYELEGFTGTMLVTIYAGNLYKQVQLRVHVLSTLKDVQLRLKLPIASILGLEQSRPNLANSMGSTPFTYVIFNDFSALCLLSHRISSATLHVLASPFSNFSCSCHSLINMRMRGYDVITVCSS